MPRPSKRTRSQKRTQKSLPGGGQRVHYRGEANAPQHCTICGQLIAGIPRISKFRTSRLNRSKKRIGRPYGGQICHNCLKSNLRQAARKIQRPLEAGI